MPIHGFIYYHLKGKQGAYIFLLSRFYQSDIFSMVDECNVLCPELIYPRKMKVNSLMSSVYSNGEVHLLAL